MQRIRYSLSALALVCIVAIAGCGPRLANPSESANSFLAETLTAYHALPQYATAVKWRATAGTSKFEAARFIEYSSPNKYRVESTHDNTLLLRSVSDGAQVTEYSNVPDMVAAIYPAPASLDAANSPQMRNPLDCGSPLYGFFGGRSNLDKVCSGQARYSGVSLIGGAVCSTIAFVSPTYGPMRVTAGNRDHLVRRIEYDGAALVAKGAATEDESAPSSGAPPFTQSMPPTPAKLAIVETYQPIQPTKIQVADADFDTSLPNSIPAFSIAQGNNPSPGAGASVPPMSEDALGKPPVPLGAPAPDATVFDAHTGASVRISSMRGKVVVLDFFASWCMPCRVSLPETQDIYERYSGRGLTVMGIDDEARTKILSFVSQNKYSFPVYQDKGLAASSAFGANAIPTIAVIDKSGRLSSYFVGPQDDASMTSALQKAGL